jgi:hypothetical protein
MSFVLFSFIFFTEFVRFQDEFIAKGKKQTRASLIEKKLTIFKKALHSNPKNEILLIGYLKEAQHLWDSAKMISFWKK